MARTSALIACTLTAVLTAACLAACSSTSSTSGEEARAASGAPVLASGESSAASTTNDPSAATQPAGDARPSPSAVGDSELGHRWPQPGYPIDGVGGVWIINDLPFAIRIDKVDMVDGYDWQWDRPDREPPQGFIGVTIPPGGSESRMLGAKSFIKDAPFRMWITSVTNTSSGPVMRPLTDVYFNKSYACTLFSDQFPIPYDCHAYGASKSWAGFGINRGDNYFLPNTSPFMCTNPWKRTFTFSQGDPLRTGTAEAAFYCRPPLGAVTLREVSP